MSRHCTIGRPASIIVANRRVNVTRSLELDARAELEAEAPRLLLDLRRLSCCAAKARLDRGLVVGLHRALAQLAGARARFPDEFRHAAERLPVESRIGKVSAVTVAVSRPRG